MPSLSVARPGAVNSPAGASPGPEDLWRIAAERSEDGIYGLGRSGRIFGWTVGAARLFGYQDDQVTELVGELLFSEHDRPLYRDIFSRVLDGETVERVALTAQRSDGMFVPVSVTLAPLDGGDGACMIARDLTERFISQQTMADSQALMAEAQMLSHFGIWLWHAPSGTVQMSEELFRIHGLHPADFDGRMQSRTAMAHRDDRKLLVRRLDSALAGLSPFEMEYRLARPNGDIRWVYERANVVTDQTGEIAGLRGICQDVTERREAADHLRRRTVLLDMLRHITVAANESSDLREALESCLQQICSTFGWPVGHAVLLGPGNVVDGNLWFLAHPDRFGRYQRAVDARPQPDAAGIAGMVLQSCEPVWVEDTSAAVPGGTLRAASEAGLRSGFGFPVAGDDGVAAVVELFSRERRNVDPDFVEATLQGATQLGRVVERIRARDYRSMHDPLTHLPNRSLLMDRLRQALRCLRPGSGLVAVMFMDLDNFKLINDTLGHDVGDRVLTTIADRLAGSVRRGDVAGRYGGDEFLVLCDQVPSTDRIVEIAARLLEIVAEPINLDEHGKTVVTGSVGIAIARKPGARAEDLVRHADAAMYTAKQRGPGRAQIYAVREGRRAHHRTTDAQ